MLVTVISVLTCISTYTITTVYIVYNLEPDALAQISTMWLHDFRFWVVWLIAWFDYFTLEIVREAWTRYNGGKASSYLIMHASVHENEMWNDIMSTWSSSRCHLRKVAYLRCCFLVLSVLPHLYWKRSAPVESSLWHYERSVMPTDHLHLWSVIVIKCVKSDRWPHVISTSGYMAASTVIYTHICAMQSH